MTGTQSLVITLPTELAEMVRAKVASGEYASESDVIQAALLKLFFPHDTEVDPDDLEIEKWLREQVAPTFDEMQAHPERGLTLDQINARLDERIDVLMEEEKSGKAVRQ